MADDSKITVNTTLTIRMPTSEEIGEELAGRLGALEYMVALALSGHDVGDEAVEFHPGQGGGGTTSAFVEAERRVLRLRDEVRRQVREQQQIRE